ncbi:CoA-binding protein [Alphaproteobacteria bacterium]|nr:CoA-binding protein [Alphaproteobacteria bacterium]
MLKNENIIYEDHYLRSILDNTKSIAMIGLSSSWQRPSYFVAKYLLDRGYKVYPVNPREAGKKILNQKVYSSVSEINENIDMVDIFRKSNDVDLIIDDIIKIKPSTIWMQIGVINFKAAKLAKINKIDVVMNKCPKIEYGRLSGELSWAGINSGVFHNKRRIIRPIIN